MNEQHPSGNVRHVMLGNPENRRVLFFQNALVRNGAPPARLVSYRDLLDRVVPVDALFEGADVLRIESPGEDFEVEKRLIARGAEHPELDGCEQISSSAALELQPDRGRLRYSRQWYLGFCMVLDDIQAGHRRHPSVALYNSPADIQMMFDKPTCQRHLQEGGLPVPDMLHNVLCYEDLVNRAREQDWNRVFVKLANGSSASGVVALYFTDRGVRAVTSIELVRQRGSVLFYNNLRLRTYTDTNDVRTLVDFLCAESAQVERWMPKASLAGRTFDLRILVIAGEAQHTVVRTSTRPMTNLHLGNRRGNLQDLISKLGEARWGAVRKTASRTASLFPRSLYAGVDLLLSPSLRSEVVLEANAFGDLLPGVVYAGQDVYAAEIRAQGRQM